MAKKIKLKIKKYGINGEGIGYFHRKPVFVDNALPNEEVLAQITEDNGKFAKAKTEKILVPSSKRRAHLCDHADQCGGCSLHHVQYKEQAKMKEFLVREALKKYADYTGEILPIIKNPNPLGYRNTLKMPICKKDGKIVSGMYAPGTQDFISVNRCIIHSKALEKVRASLIEVLNECQVPVYTSRNKEGLKSIVLREFENKVMVILITGPMTVSETLIQKIMEIENVVSLWQSIRTGAEAKQEIFGDVLNHLAGQENMLLHVDGFELRILPRSFYQLNTLQSTRLYELVSEWTPVSNIIVEAYAGIGAISLFVADKAHEVIGIESIPDAVINANENALANGKENIKFICGDAGSELEKLEKQMRINTLIVDPPRTGLDDTMLRAVKQSSVDTIIYISCNPSTLAKDIKDLSSLYTVEKVQPVDIFSQTAHVETVCLLSKIKS